ncbi:MAG: hypothetical protein Q8O19_02320 [Rectinemataceae bacterium]|nr:hypothetical protein [Rectinemataceae bacterium]
MSLIFWVYFSAQIFFLGAEFTRQYALYVGGFKLENPMVAEKKD